MKTECPKCKAITLIFNTPISYPYIGNLTKVRYVCEECGYYEWRRTGLADRDKYEN